MHKRILILPISAAVIAALCIFKLYMRDEPSTRPIPPSGQKNNAPMFELRDQGKPPQMHKLAAYFGRHRILLVFFDAKGDIENDPALLRLRKDFAKIDAGGTRVLAVSAALPQQIRKIEQNIGPYPFRILSDPGFAVHRQWGRYDEKKQSALPGMFLIDRTGLVSWSDKYPEPLSDPNLVIDRLIDQ